MLPYQKGDIIIFKAEDDWFSKAIAVLTDSDACHAAMVYSEDSIVEVGAYGIGVNKTSIAEGDAVYVMRMKGDPDYAPLIACADHYLSTGVRYDFAGLILLAGLLIYKKLPYSQRVLSVSKRILSAAALKLEGYVRQLTDENGTPAMVCSELIYQIYKDCGEQYRISIVNGTFSPKNDMEDAPDQILLAHLISRHDHFSEAPFLYSGIDEAFPDDHLLAKELYETLSEVKKDTSFPYMTDHKRSSSDQGLKELLHHAGHFISNLNVFLKTAHLPSAPEALFVTPADLAHHAVNLYQAGTLGLERIL